MKLIQIGKGEVKLYLQDDTILCIEDPNESTKKTIWVIKQVQQGCRIKDQYAVSSYIPSIHWQWANREWN